MTQQQEPGRKVTLVAENRVDEDGKWSWTVYVQGRDKFDVLSDCHDERNLAHDCIRTALKSYDLKNDSSGTCFLKPDGTSVARDAE